ncbi:phage tail protein [Escherichia coli]
MVQLSSATNSASETLAATPKAVKAANDNANGRVADFCIAPEALFIVSPKPTFMKMQK